jgi:hypothetical protein
MKRIDLINTIRELGKSQGTYYRMYHDLMIFAKNDPITFNAVMEEWENMNFSNAIDFIIWLES